MPDELQIRTTSYDHPDVIELTRMVQEYYVELYGGPDSSPIDSRQFAPPAGRFLVGYLADLPVAMGGWRFLTAAERARLDSGMHRPAELKRMYVRPEARGRGYGGLVLAELERTAVATGADWMLLQTGTPQVEGIGLYRRAGYREITPFGYFAGTDDAVHLGRRLASPEGLAFTP